jgi:hypothetical protein
MKKNAFLLATVFLIATSCSSVKVVTDLDKTIDFSNYKTVSFLGWQEDIGQVINQFDQDRIRNVLKTELEIRNLTLVDEDGDLVLSTFLVSEQKTSKTAYTSYYGGGAGRGYGRGRRGGGWGMGGSTTTYSESDYVQGTMVIDIFDNESIDLIWQGVGVGTIKEKPEKREKSLPKSIAKILKDFPIAPVK